MLEDKILVVPDTHFVMKNPSNRVDLIQEGYRILDWISNTIDKEDITRVIFLGDVFDRGYPEMNHKVFSEFYGRFKKISLKVDGAFNLLLGNHEQTYAKNNPIFHWVKLGNRAWESVKTYEHFTVKEPLMTAPDVLEYEKVVIEFNHFDIRRRYNRYKGEKKLIGLFHDTLSGMGNKFFAGSKEPVNIGNLMQDNSLVIGGHIHIPQEIKVYDNPLRTKVMVPGAMVSRTTAEVHPYVNLPVIKVYSGEDGEEPFTVEQIVYELPEFKETFIEEEVENNKTKYELQKSIKNTRKLIDSKLDLETLLDKFPVDSATRRIIIEASHELTYSREKEIEELMETMEV